MKKAYLVVAALVVLVVALLVIPYFFNLESYRPEIVERLKQMTGREVQIEGLQLSLLPRVRVVVSTVRIKNPSGFSEGDTVAVEEVHIGLGVAALAEQAGGNQLGDCEGRASELARERPRPDKTTNPC